MAERVERERSESLAMIAVLDQIADALEADVKRGVAVRAKHIVQRSEGLVDLGAIGDDEEGTVTVASIAIDSRTTLALNTPSASELPQRLHVARGRIWRVGHPLLRPTTCSGTRRQEDPACRRSCAALRAWPCDASCRVPWSCRYSHCGAGGLRNDFGALQLPAADDTKLVFRVRTLVHSWSGQERIGLSPGGRSGGPSQRRSSNDRVIQPKMR